MNLPKIAQKFPFLIDEVSGKKAFCTCGLSLKQPYCDGSHKDTGFTPEIIELSENKKVAWCGCKGQKKAHFVMAHTKTSN